MVSHEQIRWWLRIWSDPVFLRLYWAESPTSSESGLPFFDLPYSPRHAFFSLAADDEHPEEQRAGALEALEEILAKQNKGLGHRPQTWFQGVKSALDQLLESSADISDVVRRRGVVEFFRVPTNCAPPGVAEIHCHFRGAIPWTHLWTLALVNPTAASQMFRKHLVYADDGWPKKTWAELFEDVRRIRPNLDYQAELKDLVAQETGGWETCGEVRYLATVAAFRRFLIYSRGQPGLDSFVAAYSRYSKLTKARSRIEGRPEKRYWAHQICRRFGRHRVAALELRPTFDIRPRAMVRELRDTVRGYLDYLAEKQSHPFAFGLVISLLKTERHQLSLSERVELWRHQLDSLCSILLENPELRPFVVGIDASGAELGAPLRVFKPIFDRLAEYHRSYHLAHLSCREPQQPKQWADRLRAERLNIGSDSHDPFETLGSLLDRRLRRLGTTVHAGEDFVDLLTGLRQIDEAVSLLQVDRIGHSVALGLNWGNGEGDYPTFLKRRSQGAFVKKMDDGSWLVLKPRGTHLIDLAWGAAFAAEPVEKQFWARLLIEASTRNMGVPGDTERWVGHCGADVNLTIPILGANYDRLDSVDVADREWVRIDEVYLKHLKQAQERLAARVRSRNVVIESCPTSNLAIVNLREPPAKHLLRAGLKVAICTDDPGTLDSWLPEEYDKIDQEHHNATAATSAEAAFIYQAD